MFYTELPKWGKELIDQSLHFGAGFFFSLLLGPIVSLVLGGLREAFQNWGDEDNDYTDMAIDLAVWCLGIAASIVF
jgi:hypothetical protein